MKIPICRFLRPLLLVKAIVPYDILDGRVLARLRKEILKRRKNSEIVATTNCGLTKVEGGFVGLYKEGNFNSCWELNIEVSNQKGPGVEQKLWLVRFDENLGMTDIRPVQVTLDVHRGSLYDEGILEDSRLVDTKSGIVVVANFVPYPNGPKSFPDQLNAWPMIGILNRSSSEILFRRLVLQDSRPPQKNWIPFYVDECLYLQYSIQPHRILSVDIDTGICRDQFHTVYHGQDLQNGEALKGGAPPIAIDGGLLGACHSWHLNDEGEREYLTHFLLIDDKPPFPIVSISLPLKIVVPDRIQYLIAISLMDNNKVLLSYGVNDCDNYFAITDLSDIRQWFQGR